MESQLESTFFENKVLAIQTTRVSPNAVSKSTNIAFHNFNLGLHVGDCIKQVELNRQSLQKLFPENTHIQWLEQVHGNKVAEISKVTEQTVIADAMVTREKRVALAIMTADCLPILLVSKQGNEVAAIHGGWRSLATNIITNTVKKMHSPASEVYAWLGPCIGKGVFEVGCEVQATFVEQRDEFAQAFYKQSNDKYLADLHKIATLQLDDLGIQQISTLPECTYSQVDKYYSYRKNSVTGRMASIICLL